MALPLLYIRKHRLSTQRSSLRIDVVGDIDFLLRNLNLSSDAKVLLVPSISVLLRCFSSAVVARYQLFVYLIGLCCYYGVIGCAALGFLPSIGPFVFCLIVVPTRILSLSLCQLRENFDVEASDSVKHQSSFARNFLEYCCFLTLAWSIHVNGYLDDKKFRRLIFDMMVAWEFPEASSEPLMHIDEEVTIGIKAFSRIAPAVPVIADVVVSDKIFEVLTASTNNRLHFSVYDKYLIRLDRVVMRQSAVELQGIYAAFGTLPKWFS